MLKNYFLVALRHLLRNRTYSIINIAGFGLGLAVFLIISLYVIDDLSYDRFHKHADQIYRIWSLEKSRENTFSRYAISSGALTKMLPEVSPDVIAGVRTQQRGRPTLVKAGEAIDPENENNVNAFAMAADSSFFEVFDFELVQGDPKLVLREPGTGVISEEIAQRIFGDENPIGQVVTGGDGFDVTINGVFKDIPRHSHIQTQLVLPLLVNEQNVVWIESWENISTVNYLRLAEGADAGALIRLMDQLVIEYTSKVVFQPRLQKMTDVHLHSQGMEFDFINQNPGDITRVYALSIIALMVLVIASINFINLSSARATKRAREVGMRKTVGALKSQLLFQHVGESILMTMIATILALVIAGIALPYLEDYIGKELVLNIMESPFLLLGFLGVSFLVGTLAGIYPALVLSSFKAIDVMKGDFGRSRQGTYIRRFLVVFQFAISIALVTSVLLVINQLKHLRSVDLGYNRDQVVIVPIFGRDIGQQRQTFTEELRRLPAVKGVGSSFSLPGNRPGRFEVFFEGKLADPDNAVMFNGGGFDEYFLETMEIGLVQGRSFSRDFPADTLDAIILNESAARIAGWDDPIGRTLEFLDAQENRNPMRVVGVVKDFQFQDPRILIEPTMYFYNFQGGGFQYIRLAGGSIEDGLATLEETYRSVFGDRPFNSFFLDDQFNNQFNEDRQFASEIAVFSSLAIIIACLGLFGLTAYSTEQRKKEIAVRKVLGSGDTKILLLLSKEFLRWVIIANLLAWPLAHFGMKKWLDTFVHRADFTPWPFVLAGLGALLIAMMTVLSLSLKAARTNPAKSLRQDA